MLDSVMDGRVVLAMEVVAAPGANDLENGQQRLPVGGDGIEHTGWSGCGLAAKKDAVVDEFTKVADQHALGNAGDAAAELAGAHGALREAPEDGAFPAAIDDGEAGVDRTLSKFLLGYGHEIPRGADNFVSTTL
jgi:hypothetical protein